MPDYKIIIIGAGPAGIACAVQLKRYGIDPLVIEKSHTGGLIRSANLVENYPGFPQGIPGAKIASLLEKHLTDNLIDIAREEVVGLDYSADMFTLTTDHHDYRPETVIIASGTSPRKMKIPGWDRTAGNLSHDEIIPLLGVSGKEIAIIGAGDAAFDYALNLSKSNRITIYNRTARIRSLPLLQLRVTANPSISYCENHVLIRIETVDSKLELTFHTPKLDKIAATDYLLTAVGREPALSFLDESIMSNKAALMNNGRLYFIGDVHNGIYRQMSIAASDGIRCAMQIALNQ